MSEVASMRLGQVARKLNVGTSTIIEFLAKKGFQVESNPNSKISSDQYVLLAKEFAASAHDKEEASGMTIGQKHVENVVIKANQQQVKKSSDEDEILIKDITVKDLNVRKEPGKDKPADNSKLNIEAPKLQGVKVVGKIDLDQSKKSEPVVAIPSLITDENLENELQTTSPIVVQSPVIESMEITSTEIQEVIEESIPDTVPASIEEKTAEKQVEIVPQTIEIQPTTTTTVVQPEETQLIEAKADKLKGLSVLGKIELPGEKPKKPPVPAATSNQDDKKKRPRKRIQTPVNGPKPGGENKPQNQDRRNQPFDKNKRGPARGDVKEEVTDKQIQDQIKATLAKLSGNNKPSPLHNRAKYRKEKRSAVAEKQEAMSQQEDSKILKVTEFISANDLATLMNTSVNEVISACMSMGLFVSINQRLDAETITVIADEFGYSVEFTTTESDSDTTEEAESDENLSLRAPIVTIMGHVDHGKTSLLDYIRKAKVAAGEAGGITQHIGAYSVTTADGKRIAFLDTPGHEAFTAMRARGAKITDIVIIVVAADDSVMPQTKEAINHAKVAGVPIVVAINKIDKPGANAEKIKEELANINILVEDWGGKYQSQEVSAKTGNGVDALLEKVLLEAELLELKANPDKNASGTIIEASLDKGRGYVATLMVQNGTLEIGDIILAGSHYGRVKAMFDHRGNRLKKAGPSTPVQVLGLDGAPQAGDKIVVMETEREAREIANKRAQILREQNIRTRKHITLDEIGRRLAIGNFKELNIIVKGDVDGSVEALSDSLLKLSTNEIQVVIIHKGVGQISESDVLLASASDAVIVGFQVRPSASARKLAENEEIEIRLYSIIYDAINEVKDAMEGMLAPTIEEVITGNIEVREIFKISKVGTVAGCYVTDGFIKKNNKIRLIRDGIVVYTGEIGALKRFKDDVSEVKSGFECGLSIKSFNDLQTGDIIEGFENKEVKRTL